MAVVPAAAQVLAVLRYLSQQSGPVPAAAIARDVELPRSTTYHLLHTLIRDGFVVHLPEERRYGLGLSAYELGSSYTRQTPLQRLARVPLTALVDRCGHNAHLAVLHGREVVYLLEERAPGRPPLVTDVGVRLPAPLTASGRAMLAELPEAQIRALFPDPSAFVLRNEVGPASAIELRALLQRGAAARARRGGRRCHSRLRLDRVRGARAHPTSGGRGGGDLSVGRARPGRTGRARRPDPPHRVGDRPTPGCPGGGRACGRLIRRRSEAAEALLPSSDSPGKRFSS